MKEYRVRIVKCNGRRIIASKEVITTNKSKKAALKSVLDENAGYEKYSIDIIKKLYASSE